MFMGNGGTAVNPESNRNKGQVFRTVPLRVPNHLRATWKVRQTRHGKGARTSLGTHKGAGTPEGMGTEKVRLPKRPEDRRGKASEDGRGTKKRKGDQEGEASREGAGIPPGISNAIGEASWRGQASPRPGRKPGDSGKPESEITTARGKPARDNKVTDQWERT